MGKQTDLVRQKEAFDSFVNGLEKRLHVGFDDTHRILLLAAFQEGITFYGKKLLSKLEGE